MATNKVASVVLLDVGSSVSEHCGSETFFQKCQWSFLRIIQRKIFSCVADEIAVVIFGSEETENNLYHTSDGDLYSNIQEYTSLSMASWNLYEQVQTLKPTNVTNSNWIEGIHVALDCMKEQTKGKRFKDKQLIVLSNFAMQLNRDDRKLKLLAESIDLDNIKLIVIGIDLEEECKDKFLDSQLPGSIGLMFSLIDKVQSGVSLSFEEAEEDIKYYERKGKMGRFTKVGLDIGSNINIPIRWIKITLEPTRIRWVRKPSDQAQVAEPDDKSNEPEIRYVMEIQKISKFGDSQVILSYADMEAMKRESGPASCVLVGCVKRQRINRKMFVGNDIYVVVPEKIPSAQAMICAFIDALIEADKYALVRRISVKNGKVRLGVLIPVSDQAGKMFYFLQLPFAEHALVVPEVIHPEPNNKDILDIFENLIDTMTIPDKPKDIPKKDPIFQLRCHILHLYETGQLDSDINNTPVPDYIQKLCDPYPELLEDALHYIDKLEEILPTNIDDKLLELDDNYVALKGPENSSSATLTNKPDQVINEENMDWENAETQEWPQELKEKYCRLNKNSAEMPGIILQEEILSKNKYDTKYISDRILRDHGGRESEISNKNGDEENVYNDPQIEEMLQQRQNTNVDADTDEMMQRMRAKLEKQ